MRVTSTQEFMDREEELKALNEAWLRRPGLVIIYGRRRVGKTRLLMEWLRSLGREVKVTYYQAVPARHEVNLRGLAKAIEDSLGLTGLSKASFEGLDALLSVSLRRDVDAVIAIDEFTYWARGAPRVVGELQRFVDHVLPTTKALIVVTGSLVGVMHREVLGGGAPLYGRSLARIRLRGLKPKHVLELREGMGLEEAFLTYVMFGGIPHYHVVTSWCGSVEELLWEAFFSPRAVLRDEPHFILREEFRDPATYYGILQAIARGADTPSRIADLTGMHRQHVSKYLTVLEDVGFVGRDVPVLSKKGVYVIKDNLMLTWFSVIEPILSMDPYPEKEECIPLALERLNTQASKVYEGLAKEFAVKWGLKHGVRFDLVGRYVHKGTEVDVVAVSKDRCEAHLFEVKWGNLTVREIKSVVKSLLRKASSMPEGLIGGCEVVPHVVVRRVKDAVPAEPGTYVHDLTEVIETL